MSGHNPGGKVIRPVVSPETLFIDHDNRIKVLERGSIGFATGEAPAGSPGVLSGFGPPTNAVGFEGDWYVDLTNDRLYGPKGISWPTKYYSLIPYGLVWRGDYDNTLAYDDYNVVEYNGSSYIALGAVPAGIAPTNPAYWDLLAQKGDIGATGPTGVTGPIGPTGPVGIVWKGDWASGQNYFINDGVYYQGSSYRAIRVNNGPSAPDTAVLDWKLIALRGATGGGVVWRGTWVSGTVYDAGDGVTYNGSSYHRLTDGDGTTPPSTDTANWEIIAAKGDTGPAGPAGPTGLAGITWRGNWDAALSYTANDGVYYNGTSYRRTGSSGVYATSPDVDTAHWYVIAQKGTDGVSPTPLWNWRGVWSSSTDYLTGDLVETAGSTYYAPVDIAHGANPVSVGTPWELVAQRGATGPTGFTGSTGATGSQGPAGLTWRGVWNPLTAYANNDAVTYQGSSYRRQIGGTSSTPPSADTTAWELIASKGDTGLQGPIGTQGPAGAAGGVTARRAVSFTTVSLAGQGATTNDVTINLAAALYQMSVNRPARVRVYATAAYRSADATRTSDSDPTGDHGLLAEVVFVTGTLSITFAPVAELVNMDGTPTTTIYFAIQNLDVATGTITVNMTLRQDE
jgi:hypothetical protein